MSHILQSARNPRSREKPLVYAGAGLSIPRVNVANLCTAHSSKRKYAVNNDNKLPVCEIMPVICDLCYTYMLI